MEKSRFWTTNGTGDGPSAKYSMGDFAEVLRRLLTTDQETTEGVLRGIGSDLAVSGTSSPLSVAAGAGLVYGIYYENSSALSLAVSTPVSGVTGGRVNLKADWSAQTVRAVVQLNTDGNPAIPALVQTPGSAWSIPLATFTITTGGVIALVDARAWCHFATYLTADMVESLAGYSVVGRAASGAGAAAAITAADSQVLRAIDGALGFGPVIGAMIAAGAVTADKIAADSVDDTKVGDRVPQFYRRQGGASGSWATAGTTNYTPGPVRMQAGVVTVAVADGTTNNGAAITFPVAFSDKPVVLVSFANSTGYIIFPLAESITASGFIAKAHRGTATTPALNMTIVWLAIGPE